MINNSLSYMVQQALTLAGLGGEITVYSMASDVYSSGNIPEGLSSIISPPPFTSLTIILKIEMAE